MSACVSGILKMLKYKHDKAVVLEVDIEQIGLPLCIFFDSITPPPPPSLVCPLRLKF
jgi:hypothetical protein